MNDNRVLKGSVCAALGGVFWGFSGTCGQYLFSEFGVSSLWVTCLRLLCAGFLMVLLAFFKNKRDLVEIWKHPKDLFVLAMFGIFGLMFCQLSYLTGISHSNAATTTVLQQLSLIIIMLITCLQSRRSPGKAELLALALALFGTFMLATGGNPGELLLSSQGLFWGLATAAAVAAYTLIPRGLMTRWSREAIRGIGMIFGGIVLNLYARSWEFEVSLPLSGWLAFGCVVIFGTVVSFTLFLRGIQDAGAVRASMLCVTEPLSAAVFSAVWLGTTFSAAELIGFAAILATIFLLAKSE